MDEKIPIVKYTLLALTVIGLIVVLAFAGKLAENVDAGEIVVIQDPIDGELHWFTQPGLYYQNFGKPTHYRKSFQYWFSGSNDQGEAIDQSIRVRFNDGGHANISGSGRCDLPLDTEHLTLIHTKFGSQHAIEQELIRTVIEKSVYMTGPLMSSKESYAERRNEVLAYIEDQASKGVYKTVSKEVKGRDPMTGQEKTVTIVDIIESDVAPNGRAREEQSPLETFSVKLYNVSINEIKYDNIVDEQIAAQQKAVMQVQTAIAEAKQAEQKAITAEKEGQAEAAKAKWAQEVIKAKFVTEAQQKKEVAKLNKEEAEFIKQKEILLGQGEAERKKLVINADGALVQKLEAWVEVNKVYAAAIQGYTGNWVPTIVMGDATSKTGGGAQDLINLLMAKTAKDLSLELNVPKGAGK